MPSLAESRRLLLDSLGEAPSMVFVRPYGNVGDEMIWAGARELLSGHIHREITVDDLAHEQGELAVISGGGAWSQAYSDYMPEVLAIAERRFERVVVFPSTFDTGVARVRETLARSRATVFARELESFRQIAGLCDAQLAHDTAFFCPLPEVTQGSGTLTAFRTDAERDLAPLPEGNRDISATCESLDEWLETIAVHSEVHTNRAHVMIAAARMNKPVRYRNGAYFKVGAIAEACLGKFDVEPLPGDVPTFDPPDIPSEFVFLGTAGQKPQPGAIETMISALEQHPGALAAAPRLITEDGATDSCGGWPVLGGGELRVDRTLDAGETGQTGWVPLEGALIRAEAIELIPFPPLDDRECRDAEWSLRVLAQRPESLICVPEAVVPAPAPQPVQTGESIVSRAPRVRRLYSHAQILAAHDAIMPAPLLDLMPELAGESGRIDTARARLLLELVAARGQIWTLTEWMSGGLDPLLGTERQRWLEERNQNLIAIENGGWWKLRNRLGPLRRVFGKGD